MAGAGGGPAPLTGGGLRPAEGAGPAGTADPAVPGGRTAVVAIGGNALSPRGEPATVENQFRHTRESLAPIVDFACRGWKVAVVHGNGPQVGDELLRNECAREVIPPLPLGVLVAETAGWIGYMIQQSLENALARAGAGRKVATLITQVRVDRDAPSTREPRKFIGRALSPEMGASLRAEGVPVEEDEDGVLRRRVPSPEPLEVVEASLIAHLVNRGDIVVAAGGGGIPVYRDRELGLEGIDAVVDKDLAAALLGREIGAELLLLLTDVDGVYRDFGTAGARRLERLTVSEARQLLAGTQLGVGSMEPKVRAAVHFLEWGGVRAVIADLEDAPRAVDGGVGTTITPDGGRRAAGVGGEGRGEETSGS